MTHVIDVPGNKTLGAGDDGTIQLVDAVATITLPHEDTHKFVQSDKFTVISNAEGEVSIVGENGVTLIPDSITLSAKGESANVRYQGGNSYLVWGVCLALVTGVVVAIYSDHVAQGPFSMLVNYLR